MSGQSVTRAESLARQLEPALAEALATWETEEREGTHSLEDAQYIREQHRKTQILLAAVRGFLSK
jgi:hypothetical protein